MPQEISKYAKFIEIPFYLAALSLSKLWSDQVLMNALVKLQRLQEAQDTLTEMRQKHVQPLLGFGFERTVSEMTLVSLQIMKHWRVERVVKTSPRNLITYTSLLSAFAKRGRSGTRAP